MTGHHGIAWDYNRMGEHADEILAERTQDKPHEAVSGPGVPPLPHRDSACPGDEPRFLQTLKDSRREFLAIFDSVPAMIWYKDRTGTILRANQCAADSVGATARELVGRNYYELFPDNAAVSRQLDERVMQTGVPIRGQLRCFAPFNSKNPRWAMVDRFPLRDEEGHIQGVLVFAQDITEKKLAEDRLLRARKEIELRNEQLAAAVQKAERLAESAHRSNRAKSEILASSSHDLRTPMNAIIGFADLLLETTLDDEQRQYIRTIRDSADGLLLLVNDILDFARLEAGKLKIAITPCFMNEFVAQVRAMMEVSARRKGLDFQVHLDPGLPMSFYTDPLRLKQCLINLLGNAIKFTERGFVKLYVRPQRKAAKPCIQFEIEDTGIGIAPDKQEEIFKTFSQAEAAIAHKYGGSGLGLSITRRLVNLLGGTITIDSEPGRGSRFSIVLPLLSRRRDLADSVATCGRVRAGEQAGVPGRTILLVEGHVPSQVTMNLLLRRAGLTVRAAGSIDEMKRLLGEQTFDLLLLDASLCQSAAQTVMELREQGSATPIIVLVDSEADRQSLVQSGAAVLLRPVDRGTLYEEVAELTGSQAEASDKTDVDAAADERMSAAQPTEAIRLLPELLKELKLMLEESDRVQAEQTLGIIQTVVATAEQPALSEKINALVEQLQLNAVDTHHLQSLADDLDMLCRDLFNIWDQ